MTDFLADLEAELLAAARRRAAGPSRRWRLPAPRRPALVPVAVLAAVVTAIAAVAIVRAGAEPGGQERPALGSVPVAGCSVSDELLDTVPLLRRAPGEPIPQPALAAIDDVWTPVPERARPAGAAGDVHFWVVPVMRLGAGERCAPAGDACLVAYAGRTFEPACTSSSATPMAFPYRGRVLAYGLVGPEVREVELWVDGGSGIVPADDGVYAGLLSEGVTMSPRSDVHFRSFGGPRPTLAVFNATAVAGLATETAERLEAEGLARPGEVTIDNFTRQNRGQSSVFYDGEAFSARARSIARTLGIAAVRPGPTRVLELARGAPVVVVLGKDATR